jgi:beta-lactamase class A
MKRIALGWAILLAACLNGFSGQSAAQKQDLLWAKLAQNVEALDAGFDGVMGVAILDLTNGREWAYHADEVFPTASTIKLAVLAELYQQQELSLQGRTGNAKLSDLYTVRQEDLVADSAVLGNMTLGITVLTNRDLAGAVVAVSDNSASNILTNRIGMTRVNTMLDSLNLKKTRLRRQMMDLKAALEGRENVATPRELVELLRDIYENKLFRPELTKGFFTLLSTAKSSFIPKELPEDLKIANKPGELDGVRCDAGIVFVPNHPFAIAVMTSYDRKGRPAEGLIGQVALRAWRMFDVLSVSSEYGRRVIQRHNR